MFESHQQISVAQKILFIPDLEKMRVMLESGVCEK